MVQRRGRPGQAPAGQAGPGGRGRGLSPQQQAAAAKQDELEKNTPQIPYDAVWLPLLQPGAENTIGETEGVALNSQKHLFVYSRTGNSGPARGATAAKLFEFNQAGKFVKEWGSQTYGFSFAHSVKVDKDDNVWVTDEGSNMVMKFHKQGIVTMVLGPRTKRSTTSNYLSRGPAQGRTGAKRRRWTAKQLRSSIRRDLGYARKRVRQRRVRQFTRGEVLERRRVPEDGRLARQRPGSVQHAARDRERRKGNISVADRDNNRIKVYDPDLNLVKTFSNVRSPWAVCVSPGPTQYVYSADAGGKIYKLDLDGNLLGWFGTLGKKVGQFYWVHTMACPSETRSTRVKLRMARAKVTLHPATKSTK